MRYFDKQKILDSLTKEDVIKIVTDLGSNGYKEDSKGALIFQTVCHGGDSYKLYYYHESQGEYPGRLFHCYTRCGESFGIYELVIRANRCKGKTVTFYQAVRYVAQITQNLIYRESTVEENHVIDDFKWINKFRKTNKVEMQQEEVDENILQMFDYRPHETFLNDHISAETLSEFEISYWGKTNQIVIPHRDKDQRLIGIRGRYLDEEDVKNIGKYVPLTVEGKILRHELGKNLYGIHINQDAIRKYKKCLLLEAEKGVMQNHTYFGTEDFSLAVCGSSISTEQIKLLVEDLKIEELILGFDKEFRDPESWEADLYRNKLFKKIAPIIPYCRVCILWDFHGDLEYKDAPTDKGKDVLLKLLDNKVEIMMEDMKLLES